MQESIEIMRERVRKFINLNLTLEITASYPDRGEKSQKGRSNGDESLQRVEKNGVPNGAGRPEEVQCYPGQSQRSFRYHGLLLNEETSEMN
jgi:hypothetical protein